MWKWVLGMTRTDRLMDLWDKVHDRLWPVEGFTITHALITLGFVMVVVPLHIIAWGIIVLFLGQLLGSYLLGFLLTLVIFVKLLFFTDN